MILFLDPWSIEDLVLLSIFLSVLVIFSSFYEVLLLTYEMHDQFHLISLSWITYAILGNRKWGFYCFYPIQMGSHINSKPIWAQRQSRLWRVPRANKSISSEAATCHTTWTKFWELVWVFDPLTGLPQAAPKLQGVD
jgi:hypothetical protein